MTGCARDSSIPAPARRSKTLPEKKGAVDRPYVLIFSSRDDAHAEFVIKRLPADVRPIMLDLNDYGQTFTFAWGGEAGAACRLSTVGSEFPLREVRSLWWRRPFGTRGQTRWPSHNGRQHPTLAFILGAIGTLRGRAMLINDPQLQFEADRKILQLHTAAEVGFAVPETIITSDVHEAKAFRSKSGPLVVKGLAGPAALAGTRLFEHDAEFDVPPETPLIFQRYLPATLEHRVIYCNGVIHGGTFDIAHLDPFADIRNVPDLVPSRTQLPDDVRERLTAYCSRLGLRYAALDLREADGTFFFLEANTAGEWLYVDECNDWAITSAIVMSLYHGGLHVAHVDRTRNGPDTVRIPSQMP